MGVCDTKDARAGVSTCHSLKHAELSQASLCYFGLRQEARIPQTQQLGENNQAPQLIAAYKSAPDRILLVTQTLPYTLNSSTLKNCRLHKQGALALRSESFLLQNSS